MDRSKSLYGFNWAPKTPLQFYLGGGKAKNGGFENKF